MQDEIQIQLVNMLLFICLLTAAISEGLKYERRLNNRRATSRVRRKDPLGQDEDDYLRMLKGLFD